jgi:hypothetical protein
MALLLMEQMPQALPLKGFRLLGNEVTLENLIIRNFENTVQHDAIHSKTSNITVHMHNLIIYNIARSALMVQNTQSNSTYNVYNVTGYNLMTNPGATVRWPALGFDACTTCGYNYTDVVIDVRNTYIQAVAVGEDAFELGGNTNIGEWAATSTNNASDDGTAPGSNPIHNVVITATPPVMTPSDPTILVSNLTIGSEDLRLVDNSYNIALNRGSDLTGIIPQDIEGDTIAGNFHVGADWIDDTTAPVVNEVLVTEIDGVTPKANGFYLVNEQMSFVIEFSEPVIISGTPSLDINASATAVDCGVHPSNPNAMKCDYTVGSNDSTYDLEYINSTSIALNGGSITDLSLNPADTTLSLPGAAGSISDNQDIAIAGETLVLDVYVQEAACGGTPLCYNTLNDAVSNFAFESGYLSDGDLASRNMKVIIHIIGAWTAPDTQSVFMSAGFYNSTSDNNITIIAEGAARHSGIIGANNYVFAGTHASNWGAIWIQTKDVVLDGFIIDGANLSHLSGEGIRVEADNVTVQNMIIHNLDNQFEQDGIHIPNGVNDITVNIYNTLFYNINRAAIMVQGVVTNTKVNVYNVTAYNVVLDPGSPIDADRYSAIGFDGNDMMGWNYLGSEFDIRNTFAQAVDASSFAYRLGEDTNSGSWSGTSSNNISDDASAPGSNSITNAIITDFPPVVIPVNPNFVVANLTPGAEDLRVVDNTHNIAHYNGVDLSSFYTTDINGDTIGSFWHIGADYLAADSSAPVITEINADPSSDRNFIDGEIVSITVKFSEPVSAPSSSLVLNTAPSRSAIYFSGTGTNELTYRYTVQPGDTGSDINVDSFTSAAGVDFAGNSINLALPATNNLANNRDININGVTTITAYVRPDAASCSTSPNPTLCFTSLSAVDGAIVGLSSLTSKNLASQNQKLLVSIGGDWSGVGPDTAHAEFSGWTTDSNYHIEIITEGAARHNGVASCTSCYKLNPSAVNSNDALKIGLEGAPANTAFTIIDGLIITGTTVGGGDGIEFHGNGSTLRNTILYDFPFTNSAAINTQANVENLYIENVIVYGDFGRGVQIDLSTAPTSAMNIHISNSVFYSNTTLSGTSAIYSSEPFDLSNVNVILKNTMLLGNYDDGTINIPNASALPNFNLSERVLISDDDLGLEHSLSRSKYMPYVTAIDSSPFVYTGSINVLFNRLQVDTEDFHTQNSAFNIAQSGGVSNTARIPYDIDGDLIASGEDPIGPDFVTDNLSPIVAEVYVTEDDGLTLAASRDYTTSENISVVIEFTEFVDVIGSPQLTVNTGVTLTCRDHAEMFNAIRCDYSIGAGDTTPALEFTSTTALSLAGGNITDGAGNTANLTLPLPGNIYSISDNQTLNLTGVGPLVTIGVAPDINATNETTYNLSGTCNVFGGPVNIDINSGAVTTSTVCSGAGSWSITGLNVSTVLDSVDPSVADVLIEVTHSNFSGLVGPAADILVVKDTTPPAMPTLITPANGATLTNPSDIAFNMDGSCETDAIVEITGSGLTGDFMGTCTLGVFSIPVTLTPSNGVKNFSIVQTDPAGNTSAALNGSYTLNIFILGEITATNPDGAYREGQTIQIVATFTNNIVSISGTPSITLDTGDVVNMASNAGATITFEYTIGPGDSSSDLTVTNFNSGGTIEDSLSQNADVTVAIPGANNDLDEVKNIIVDTQAPIFDASTFALNGGEIETQNSVLDVSFQATDDLSTITHICYKWQNNTQPLIDDPCWIDVTVPSIGRMPANDFEVPSSNFTVGFTPQAYTVYGFLKDGAGNISSHTASSGTDQDDIIVFYNNPPAISGIITADSSAPNNPITAPELIIPAGDDVFIKWDASDIEGLKANPINLYYTLDGENFIPIPGGQNLLNSSNGGCIIDDAATTADDTMTGCFTWTSGSPTNNFYRIRVEAVDSYDTNTTKMSNPLNDNKFRIIAGNTDRGIGNVATSVIFTDELGSSSDTSSRGFVVMPNGDIYILDEIEGLIKITASTGVTSVFIKKGTSATYEGPIASARVRNINKMIVDYNYDIYIHDYDRIRKIDMDAGTITTVIGGGTNTAPDGVAGTDVEIQASDNGNYLHHVLFATPDGKIHFRRKAFYGTDSGFYDGAGTFVGFYTWDPTTGLVTRNQFTRGAGNGSVGWAAYDPEADICRLAGLYISHDMNRTNTSFTEMFFRADGSNCGGDPDTVNINPSTFATQTPHPNSNIDSYFLNDPIYGMDGKIYAISNHSDSGAFEWDPIGKSFVKILGGTVGGTVPDRGFCADNTPATSCAVKSSDLFVTESGQVYFKDDGVIRTIDENGRVQTLYGQRKDFGDGGLATEARFNWPRDFEIWNDGGTDKFVVIDKNALKFREFTIGGTISTIIGTGNEGAFNWGDPGLSNLRSLSTGAQFVMHPTTGDIFFHDGFNEMGRWDRSADSWVEIWDTGAPTFGWNAADGVNVNTIKWSDLYADKPLAIDVANNRILFGVNGYSGTTSDNAYIFSYDYTDSTFTSGTYSYILGQPGNHRASGGKICSAGTLPASCTLGTVGGWDYGDDNGAVTAVYDANSDTWLVHDRAREQQRISQIKKNTAIADFTTLNNPAISFTHYYDSGNTTDYIFYCGQNGNLYKRNVTLGTEETLVIPTPGIKCASLKLDYDETRDSLIFIFSQDEMMGIGEYFSP